MIKHSRKVLGIVKARDGGFSHKLWEIFVEILIIVFAISLSLFLERWRQRAEDRELEKKFLEGLQVDLRADLEELKPASARWASMKNAANYFLKPEIDWNSDSTTFYSRGQLFHNVYFFPNTNRYESLKSAGKLGVIENEELQNDIIDLYQTRIPDLEQQIGFFNAFMNSQVKDYFIHKLNWDSKNQPLIDRSFLSSAEMKSILVLYPADLSDLQKRSDSVISKSEKILREIEQASGK